MCTNQKIIHPKYSKRPMYVKCGHCPACLQEKAAKRVKRIHDTLSSDYACFMVCLTYSQGTSPYVDRSEAYEFVNGRRVLLSIYRDCEKRKVRKVVNGNDYAQVYKTIHKRVELGNIELPISALEVSLKNTKDLKHEYGKIGVCYYQDYQHFVARLRLNLKRHFGYDGKLYIYACSEYGTRSQRPHFHLLVFIEKSAETFLRDAVIESWPFSNLARFPRAIERSYRGASYVASYVNQSSNFPLFFKTYAKPKHSYSKGFGLANKEYSLSKILEKTKRGYLAYTTGKCESGIIRTFDVPIPSYVVNRYFPKFKTSTRCSPSSLYSYMRRIYTCDWSVVTTKLCVNEPFPRSVYHLAHENLYLNEAELLKISVRLRNAHKRFVECAPDGVDTSLDGYLNTYISVWNAYNSTILRLHLLNDDIPFLEKYDNWDSVQRLHKYNGLNVVGVYDYDNLPLDPNKYISTRISTALWESSFHEHIKHREVSNAIYMAADADCEL